MMMHQEEQQQIMAVSGGDGNHGDEPAKKKKKFLNVDRGKDFYIGLLMQKKVRHFRGEFSQLAFNHHIMPSARMALLELNERVNASKCEDDDLSVDDFICVESYTAIADAKRPHVVAAENKEPLPEIGMGDHVVRFELYDLKAGDLPAEIEFACNAVLAKFKATGQRIVTSVSFDELNDSSLIMQAQSLFGAHIGKIWFRKPFQPYACECPNAEGEVSVYAFRVKPTGRFKRALATDVWTLKPLKEKKKDDDVTEPPRDEVFTVLFHLFPSADRYERTHVTHFDDSSVKKLQNAFEKAIEVGDFEQKWKDIGSYGMLGESAIEVLKTDDFLTGLNFFFFFVKYLWSYTLRGSPMDSCSQMSLLKKFVCSEVKRWTDRRMTHYVRPVKEEEGEEEEMMSDA